MEPDSRAHDAILEAVERSHCRALGQNISLLIKRVDGEQFEDSVSNFLADPVVTHIDVLGSGMLDRSFREKDCGVIVAVDAGEAGLDVPKVVFDNASHVSDVLAALYRGDVLGFHAAYRGWRDTDRQC